MRNSAFLMVALLLTGGFQAVSKAESDTSARLRSGDFGFTKLLVTQRARLTPSHVYTYHVEGNNPGGGLWVCDLSGTKPNLTKILDSSSGQILDANLHYDGETILFSWKRTMKDPFQLFTIKIDGSGLTQITDHKSNNFNACWLPDGNIAHLSDRKPAYAYCWKTSTPVLYRSKPDGSDLVRLSANYLNDFTPSVLSNGRILYSRWEYVDRPAIPIQSLWTINPDGTGLMGLYGNRSLSPATFMDGREIPGTNGKILAVLTSHNGPCRGAIGIVDPSHGSNAQEGIKNLTPEVDIGRVDKGSGNRVRGPYLNPFPLDDQHYLVSKDGRIELRDYAGKLAFPLIEKQEFGFYCPQPIRTRQTERELPSALPTPSTSNEQAWGTMIMQNVYEGLEGAVAPGEITKLAIVQEVEKPLAIDPALRAFGFQFPVVSSGATYAPKKIWGYATVEKDGSAHFKVPAQEPIYFLPLDKKGRAVQRMRTFTHVMPGEVQGCIGCHTDHNAFTPKTAGPGAKRPTAMLRSAEELTQPSWGVHGFSYAQLVQPIWDKHCSTCHGRETPAGDLDLTGDKTDFFNVSYDNLVRRGTSAEDSAMSGKGGQFKTSAYTSWIPTYNGQEENILEVAPGRWGAKASRLATLIDTGHPDKHGKSRTTLSHAEKARVYAWLDLNCPYYGSSDSNYRENRGCRQILPEKLNETLAEISERRCAQCHKDVTETQSLPNSFAVRLDNPRFNAFLRAPLARSSGGTEACGTAVFKSTADSDYQKLLRLFDPLADALKKRPRMDMLPVDQQDRK